MRVLGASLIAVILGSCSISQFAPSRLNETYPQRTSADQIELFRSSRPTKDFTELGVASACCYRDTNVTLEKLREQASKSGGDALIGIDIDARGVVTATVIRYR